MNGPYIAELVTFGLGGHTVYWTPEITKTGSCYATTLGHDTPENFPSKHRGDAVFPAGTPVVDGRPAYQSSQGVRLAMMAPMTRAGLQTPDRFAEIPGVEKSLVVSAFKHGDGTQQGLARLADVAIEHADFSGLDTVPIAMYVAWMKKYAGPFGARFGAIGEDGDIVWEELKQKGGNK